MANRIFLVPQDRLAELITGRARITNLPPNFELPLPRLLVERFADYKTTGLVISHPSFTEEMPQIVKAQIAETPAVEPAGDIPMPKEAACFA